MNMDLYENQQMYPRTTKSKKRLSNRILDYFGHIARRKPDNLDMLIVTGKE